MFDQLKDDLKRHGSILMPTFWAICNYRYGNWAFKIRFPPFRWLASKLYGLNFFIILITSGIELNREARIGKNLHLLHPGNIHIHPKVIIGDRCGIMHDVTIGTNMTSGVPTIGNDVFIGAGAKVLGEITIGDGALVGANSVITTNVPPGATAIGVPARIFKRNRLKTSYRETTRVSSSSALKRGHGTGNKK